MIPVTVSEKSKRGRPAKLDARSRQFFASLFPEVKTERSRRNKERELTGATVLRELTGPTWIGAYVPGNILRPRWGVLRELGMIYHDHGLSKAVELAEAICLIAADPTECARLTGRAELTTRSGARLLQAWRIREQAEMLAAVAKRGGR